MHSPLRKSASLRCQDIGFGSFPWVIFWGNSREESSNFTNLLMSWFLTTLNIYETQVPAAGAQTFSKKNDCLKSFPYWCVEGRWMSSQRFLQISKEIVFSWVSLTSALASYRITLRRGWLSFMCHTFSSLYLYKHGTWSWSLLKKEANRQTKISHRKFLYEY